MDNNLFFKKKAVFYLAGAVLLFLLATFIHSFNATFVSNEKIAHTFQKNLLEKEKEVDALLGQAKKLIVQPSGEADFELFYNNLTPADKKYISLCVFKAGKLLYWSNNSIQIYPDEALNNFDSSTLNISNGTYIIRQARHDDQTLYGLLQVKMSYPYENEHLANNFAAYLSTPADVQLIPASSEFPIVNSNGAPLFSLDFSDHSKHPHALDILLAFIFFLAYILLLSAVYYAYRFMGQHFNQKLLLLLAFVIDVFLIRFVFHYFSFPGFIHTGTLFSPELYASSRWSSSLGDLILNIFTLFAAGYAFHNYIRIKSFTQLPGLISRVVISQLGIVLTFVAYFLLVYLLESLVLNSSISFNLADITSISIFSLMGFTCFGLLLFVFYFFTFKPAMLLFGLVSSWLHRLLIFSIYFAVAFALSAIFPAFDPVYFVFLFLYFILVGYIHDHRDKDIRFSTTVLYILLFSLLATLSLNRSVTQKEQASRTLLAQKLINQRDPIIEYNFSQAASRIQEDAYLRNLLTDFPGEDKSANEFVIDYIYTTYFATFKANSEIWLTLCDSGVYLDLSANGSPENCFLFFGLAVEEFGIQTEYENLYYIDNVRDEDNYLGVIELGPASHNIRLFVEIFNIYATSKIGYPELLVDEKEGAGVNLADYSYCMYESGIQLNQYGSFFYALNLSQYNQADTASTTRFFSEGGYNHLLYSTDGLNAIIVSTRNRTLLDVVAPFSYISIFLGAMSFLFFLLFGGPGRLKITPLRFKKRLQISVTAIIITSFLFVGIGSMFYIVSINHNKNISVLQEKSRSVLIELKHKLEEEADLTPEMEDYLESLLIKFSQVFFTDINLYDLEGQLLATSRKQVFRRGLVSGMMDATAYLNMHSLEKSLFIQEEKIGEYAYLSAYMPLRNNESNLIAYLNLPYFAKQDELTNEISAFLVAFLNVYVILIAFSIYLALVIANYITRPIELIREHIGRLKLGRAEEKIEWHRQDEIGGLVAEYNRMVDELAQSADLLAKSERESAWREMAKQIAHEIKNPLTPMKLSVQYLQKAWDEKAPDWDDQLKRFTDTIVEQINSLSVIASEFSDFAKMPRSRFQHIELGGIIQNAIGIFKSSTAVTFQYEIPGSCIVFADKEQLLRVFNNLIKNSLQAIPDEGKGVIRISVVPDEFSYHIWFSDNGKGIPAEMQEKVFYPNFTTKSGGMGLGLAMVKNIVENAKGSISFHSEESVGTKFHIVLPRSLDVEATTT